MPATARKIERRPPRETAAKREHVKRMTPAELMEVAREMVAAADPKEAKRLEDKFIRGFYGK